MESTREPKTLQLSSQCYLESHIQPQWFIGPFANPHDWVSQEWFEEHPEIDPSQWETPYPFLDGEGDAPMETAEELAGANYPTPPGSPYSTGSPDTIFYLTPDDEELSGEPEQRAIDMEFVLSEPTSSTFPYSEDRKLPTIKEEEIPLVWTGETGTGIKRIFNFLGWKKEESSGSWVQTEEKGEETVGSQRKKAKME
jgi:hypothetical protein